jgi:glycine/D-amino acid oxidase-like deaminating enzyme
MSFFSSAQASGVKGAKACLSYTAASLWPYKLTLGLLSKVLETGAVNLQTFTPVTSVITKGPNSHMVQTPRGSICAQKVVFATNAYTFGLLPEYATSIIPCRGICCHITVPDGCSPPFLPYSYVIFNEQGQKHDSYLISRPDGSIIVGGAQKVFREDRNQWYNIIDDSALIEPVKDFYNDYMQRTFKGWEDSRAYVKEIWTGSESFSNLSNPEGG